MKVVNDPPKTLETSQSFESPEAAAQHLVDGEALVLFCRSTLTQELTAEGQAAKTMIMVVTEALRKAAGGRVTMNHVKVEALPHVDALNNMSVHQLIALRT